MVGVRIDDHVISKQLLKMEQIIDKKAADLERANYEKYLPIFETAARFLKRKQVLMYGGMAIHEIMPKNLKLYGEYTLPDIDVFSYKHKEVARELVQYMKKHGYAMTSLGEALHEGTLKVFSQGQQILDITYIPRTAFRRLAKNAVIGSLGIRIVDPQYLRMSLHNLLAFPNIERWPKVLKRIINFYKAFPPKKCKVKAGTEKDAVEKTIIDQVYAIPTMANAVHMGTREIQMILEMNDEPVMEGVPPIIAFVENPAAVAKEIAKEVPDLKVSEVYDAEVHQPLPAHVFLTYHKKKVVLLFDAVSCFTFITFKHRRVASLHSIIYIYLSILGSLYKHFDSMVDSIECIANALTYVQLNSFQSHRKLLQQFALECFGPEYGVATLRRARMERRKGK